MSRFIWGLTALILMGCPNGNPHTDDTGTDTDTDDPSQMARLTVNVTLLGAPEPCFVRLDGNQVGPSGEEIEVPAGSYELTVGSDEMTADNLPIHRDAENVPWVAVPADLSLTANADKNVSVALNRYFSAPFNCVEEEYEYDPENEAGDYKGDHQDTSYYDEFMLSVEGGNLAVTPNEFDVGGSLHINGASFSWECLFGDADDCFMVDRDTSGQIWVADNGDTTFRGVFVIPLTGKVKDVTCEEE